MTIYQTIDNETNKNSHYILDRMELNVCLPAKTYLVFGLLIVCLLFIFLFHYSNIWNTFYNNKNKISFSENYEESNNEQSYGFVITRHVKSEETNKIWLTSNLLNG